MMDEAIQIGCHRSKKGGYMTLVDVHNRLAVTAMLYAVALSLWGFWRFFRKQPVDSSFWGALVIGEALILLQGLLGAYLWFNNHRPDRTIHLLYGIVSALAVPAVFAYTRGRAQVRDMLIYGAVLLFLAGILLRAYTTG
jgi:hypothetical protein